MLRWWFEHLGEPMTHEGQACSRYLLWHPRDHIHWELVRRAPDRGTGKGARFRIVEAFAANPNYYVDSTEYVEKLEDDPAPSFAVHARLENARNMRRVDVLRDASLAPQARE